MKSSESSENSTPEKEEPKELKNLFGRKIRWDAIDWEIEGEFPRDYVNNFLQNLKFAHSHRGHAIILYEDDFTGTDLTNAENAYYALVMVSQPDQLTVYDFRQPLPLPMLARLLGFLPPEESEKKEKGYYTKLVTFLYKKFLDRLVKGISDNWYSSRMSRLEIKPPNVLEHKRKLIATQEFNKTTIELFRSRVFLPTYLNKIVLRDFLQQRFPNIVGESQGEQRKKRKTTNFERMRINDPFGKGMVLLESGYTILHYDNNIEWVPYCPRRVVHGRGGGYVNGCVPLPDPMGDSVGAYDCKGSSCDCECHHSYRQTLVMTDIEEAKKISRFLKVPIDDQRKNISSSI